MWEIPQTGEIFDSYDAYLHRRDFYHQKNFTCEITGHSNLTFLDALESETQGSRELDSTFPEPLRGPVLRKVQHSTIGRVEQLVGWVFEAFKQEFFLKERVTATTEDGDKVDGLVREKVTFPDRYFSDGRLDRRGFSQYFIVIDEDPKRPHQPLEAVTDGGNLFRDRRQFSKQILRSFLKNSLTKEAWHGAPWQVKERLALQHGIPTDVPAHLQYDARQAERKAAAMYKKAMEAEANGTAFHNFLAAKQPQRSMDIRPHPNSKGPKHKFIHHEFGSKAGPRQIPPEFMNMLPNADGGMSAEWATYITGKYSYPLDPMYSKSSSTLGKQELAPPQPTMKFPTEDLDVPPRRDGQQRPALAYFAEELPRDHPPEAEAPKNGLQMKAMGQLLDIWNTLNVHSEVFILDSFTIDDFAEAVRFQSQEVECVLLNEIHCAVLKLMVDEDGEVLVDLPEFDEEDEDDSDEDDEEDEDEPDPDPEPLRRRTRSSFAKPEEVTERSPTPDDKPLHRAAELLSERPWVDRLQTRDLKDGAWVPIMVGILHQLSLEQRTRARCDEILVKLAPLDEEPEDDTVTYNYNELDVNLRVDALSMLLKLTVGTRAIREHLERMGTQMTSLRKDRLEQQRMKKEL